MAQRLRRGLLIQEAPTGRAEKQIQVSPCVTPGGGGLAVIKRF